MSLARFVARRILGAILFVFVVASLTFLLARLAPGDVGDDESLASRPGELQTRRAQLGLDGSLGMQYLRWVRGLARFDLGRSSLYSRPVSELVGERAVNTAVLAAAALFVATILGLLLGRFTGVDRTWRARAARFVSLLVLSVPPLLSSLMLVLVAARTGWAPIGGMTSADLSGLAWLADLVRHLPVPVLALALPVAATLERVQSRAMAEASGRPFVRASLARGLDRHEALRRHAWPASLAPVLGVYGVIVGGLFSGSFVVEVVTAWPGLGRLLFDALRARDVWLVAGCGAAGAACLAIGTTLADVLHAIVDPRVLDEGHR